MRIIDTHYNPTCSQEAELLHTLYNDVPCTINGQYKKQQLYIYSNSYIDGSLEHSQYKDKDWVEFVSSIITPLKDKFVKQIKDHYDKVLDSTPISFQMDVLTRVIGLKLYTGFFTEEYDEKNNLEVGVLKRPINTHLISFPFIGTQHDYLALLTDLPNDLMGKYSW